MWVFLKGIFKKLKKIQPFKALGKVARSVVGAVPIVGGVASTYLNAQQNVDARKQAGEAPALAFLNGVSDSVRQPLSGPNDRQALGGAGLLLLIGGGILVVVLLLRK